MSNLNMARALYWGLSTVRCCWEGCVEEASLQGPGAMGIGTRETSSYGPQTPRSQWEESKLVRGLDGEDSVDLQDPVLKVWGKQE